MDNCKRRKKKGAKVVVIDSYKSRTAKEADWHICPKPGTDGALAMALINHIIYNNLTDLEYINKYTNGFDQLKVHVYEKTPEWASNITGISINDIKKLGTEIATEQPVGIRIGVALERHNGGGQTIRAVTCIPGLTGAWKHVSKEELHSFQFGNIPINLTLFVGQIGYQRVPELLTHFKLEELF